MNDTQTSLSSHHQASDGLHALTHAAHLVSERHPILEVISHKFRQILPRALKDILKQPVSVHLETLKAIRFGNFLNTVADPSWSSVLTIREWHKPALLIIDSALFYAVIDAALGGRNTVQPEQFKKHSFTPIEQNLAERLVRRVLESFTQSFSPFQIHFDGVRHETSPRLAAIVHPHAACILMSFSVGIKNSQGPLHLLIPYSSLEPIRDRLSAMYTGEQTSGAHRIWTEHIRSQLHHAQIALTATLEERTTTLGTVLGWTIGTVILKDIPLDPLITLHAGDRLLMKGRMNHTGTHRIITLEESLL